MNKKYITVLVIIAIMGVFSANVFASSTSYDYEYPDPNVTLKLEGQSFIDEDYTYCGSFTYINGQSIDSESISCTGRVYGDGVFFEKIEDTNTDLWCTSASSNQTHGGLGTWSIETIHKATIDIGTVYSLTCYTDDSFSL